MRARVSRWTMPSIPRRPIDLPFTCIFLTSMKLRLPIWEPFYGASMRPLSLVRSEEMSTNKPHGNRVKYTAGCRCDLCRKANARYSSKRNHAAKFGDWNGLVDAAPARKYLVEISKAGVGRRAVSATTDIPQSTLSKISSGHRLHIRKRNFDKIMSVTVDSASDSALISSRATWMQVDELLEEGFSVLKLSQVLGLSRQTLTTRRSHILACTAARVDRFYRSIMKEAAA